MDAYLLTAAKISIHFGNLVVFQAGFLVGQSELFLHVLAQGILVYKHVDSLGTYVAFRHVQVTAEVIAVGSPRVLGDVVLRAVLVLGNAGEVHQVVIGCHKRFVSFLADFGSYLDFRQGYSNLKASLSLSCASIPCQRAKSVSFRSSVFPVSGLMATPCLKEKPFSLTSPSQHTV